MKMDTGADIVLRWDAGADECVGRIDIMAIDGARVKIGVGMRRTGWVLIRLGMKLLFGSVRDAKRWDEDECDDDKTDDRASGD